MVVGFLVLFFFFPATVKLSTTEVINPNNTCLLPESDVLDPNCYQLVNMVWITLDHKYLIFMSSVRDKQGKNPSIDESTSREFYLEHAFGYTLIKHI